MDYKVLDTVIEVAEKINSGEINHEDKAVTLAESVLADIFKTEDGRTELASYIVKYVEDEYHKYNFAKNVFNYKNFKLTDIPIFKTHKKGIIAYKTAPDSYVPKSENYETEITMSFDNMGVRPTAQLTDLKTGRIDSLASLIQGAYEALETLTIKEVMKLLSQTFNLTANSKNYVETNTVNKVALDKMINVVRKKTLMNPTIVGNYDLVTQIEAFPEFKGLESVYQEIRTSGCLGMYRGCKLVYLPDIIDEVSNKPLFPDDTIFFVAKKIGFFANQGAAEVEQDKDMNDKSWECRIDKRYGMLVTRPEGLAVMKVVPEVTEGQG